MELFKNNNSKLNHGFTLAEVLITLVIIGVVAALTIPTAINKYKDEELKSRFKKAYSTITQALHQTELNDFFGYVECYYPYNSLTGVQSTNLRTKCSSFFKAFVKKLSVQKTCNGNALSEGCVPVYDLSVHAGCGGYSQDNINTIDNAYVLSNGQLIVLFQSNRTDFYPIFLVDINGHKGPNAYGKDLFSFKIVKDTVTKNFYVDSEDCIYPVSDGRTTKEMILYSLAGKK